MLGGPVRQRTANKVFLPSYVFFLVVFYAISYRRKGSQVIVASGNELSSEGVMTDGVHVA